MRIWTVEDDCERPAVCLACGCPIEAGLTFVASLRCAQCRDDNVLLDEALVADLQVPISV
jgi:hypothetical protein